MRNNNLIKRTKKNANFTIIDNEILKNLEMSFEAKGLLCYILSLPDDWVLHTSQIMSQFKIGRTYLQRCFNEIEAAGYMIKVGMVKGVKGRFEGYSYMFYDEPKGKQLDSPHTQNPHTVKPHTANEHLLSTNSNKELNTTNTPISPKGDLGDSLDIEEKAPIKELAQTFAETYQRVYHHMTRREIPIAAINLPLIERKIRKLGATYDHDLIFGAMIESMKDSWEQRNNYPSSTINKLFDASNLLRWTAKKQQISNTY